MIHIFLIYSICAFAFGMTAITITFMCARYSHNIALRKFSLFFLAFSIQVFVRLVCGYLYSSGSAIGTFILPLSFLASLLVYVVLLWAIAIFPLALFREKKNNILSAVFFVFYALYFFLVLSGSNWQNQYAEYTSAPYLGPLYILTLFGTNAWALLYSLLNYKKADKDVRELLHFILPLLVLFLPAWLGDFFMPYSITILFSLTLYIFFGILLLRFSLKIFRSAVSANYSPEMPAWPLEKILSVREQEILVLILQGEENNAIGEKLFISINTVKTHIKNILRKTGTTDRFSLLLKISRLSATQSAPHENSHP